MSAPTDARKHDAQKLIIDLTAALLFALRGQDRNAALGACALAAALLSEDVEDGREAFVRFTHAAFDRVARLGTEGHDDA